MRKEASASQMREIEGYANVEVGQAQKNAHEKLLEERHIRCKGITAEHFEVACGDETQLATPARRIGEGNMPVSARQIRIACCAMHQHVVTTVTQDKIANTRE